MSKNIYKKLVENLQEFSLRKQFVALIAIFCVSFVVMSTFFYINFRSLERNYNKNKEILVPLYIQITESNRLLEMIKTNLLDYSSQHTVQERNLLMVGVVHDLDKVDTMIQKIKSAKCAEYIKPQEIDEMSQNVVLLKTEVWNFFGYKALLTHDDFTPLSPTLTHYLKLTSQGFMLLTQNFTKIYFQNMNNEYDTLSTFIPKMLIFAFAIALVTASLIVGIMVMIYKNLGADPKDIRRVCGSAIEGYCYLSDAHIIQNAGGVFAELFLLIQFIKEKEIYLQTEVDDQINIIHQQNKDLVSASRAAAMGEMIANIAHQWRQPLHSIGLNLIDARFNVEEFDGLNKEKGIKLITTIEDQVRYLSKTIDDFRNFFNPQKEKSFFTLLELSLQLESLVKVSLESRNITFENTIIDDTENSSVSIYGYSNELLQVILNIVSNAKDAVLENEQESKTITFFVAHVTPHTIELVVRDNGGGICDDVMPKIFEPYFSTKHQKQGTGIGLYMSRVIVEDHHKGELYAVNTDDGAEFHIVLPLHN